MRFTAELEGHGGNTAGFVVPEEVVAALGAGRRPKVVVTLGEHSWRSSLASMGGRMLLGVSLANRAAAGARVGEVYDVGLIVDDQPRVVEVPAELAAAFAEAPDAKTAWDRLSYSHQREHAEAITGGKAEATRQRRVQRTLAMLRGGQ